VKININFKKRIRNIPDSSLNNTEKDGNSRYNYTVIHHVAGAAPDIHYPGMMIAPGHHYVAPSHAQPPPFSLIPPPGVTSVSSHHHGQPSNVATVVHTPISMSAANHPFISADHRINSTAISTPIPKDSPPSSLPTTIAGICPIIMDQKSIRPAPTTVPISMSRCQLPASVRSSPAGYSGHSPSSTDSGGTPSPATTPSSSEAASYRVRAGTDGLGAPGSLGTPGSCPLKSEVV